MNVEQQRRNFYDWKFMIMSMAYSEIRIDFSGQWFYIYYCKLRKKIMNLLLANKITTEMWICAKCNLMSKF